MLLLQLFLLLGRPDLGRFALLHELLGVGLLLLLQATVLVVFGLECLVVGHLLSRVYAHLTLSCDQILLIPKRCLKIFIVLLIAKFKSI